MILVDLNWIKGKIKIIEVNQLDKINVPYLEPYHSRKSDIDNLVYFILVNFSNMLSLIIDIKRLFLVPVLQPSPITA